MEARGQKDNFPEGIHILDLADEKASFCSKLLADMGARVTKVERPGGDASRKIGPFSGDFPHPERSLFFFHNNTNKMGITLNLEHWEGRKIFCRLVEKADVVVESFSPGALEELGLHDQNAEKDLEELRSLLSSWRDTKKAMWSTIVKVVTTAVLLFMAGAVGFYVKNNIAGQ